MIFPPPAISRLMACSKSTLSIVQQQLRVPFSFAWQSCCCKGPFLVGYCLENNLVRQVFVFDFVLRIQVKTPASTTSLYNNSTTPLPVLLFNINYRHLVLLQVRPTVVDQRTRSSTVQYNKNFPEFSRYIFFCVAKIFFFFRIQQRREIAHVSTSSLWRPPP